MAVIDDVFNAVKSHALASGLFDRVETAEPKSAPGSGVSCGIWIQNLQPGVGTSGLAATTARVELWVRLYTSALSDPAGVIDPNMARAANVLMAAYSGDFSLGVAQVRNVDLLGETGTPLSYQAGYLEADRHIYRVITITLPIIVNDLFTQAA